MTRLAGVRAVVTGASRGVGRAVAEAFVAEGARVVATATAVGHLDALCRASPPGSVVPVTMDLADPASVTDAARRAMLALERCDVLVNNAGVLGTRGPLLDAPAGELRGVLDVNLVGVVALTRETLPWMTDGGAIINVTSGAAARADWGAYAVSKAAMEAVTAMLRVELEGRRIRCVAVNPGGTRTAMRAAAYPHEDPATVPHPRAVTPVFVAVAEGLDPGWRVDAQQWTP